MFKHLQLILDVESQIECLIWNCIWPAFPHTRFERIFPASHVTTKWKIWFSTIPHAQWFHIFQLVSQVVLLGAACCIPQHFAVLGMWLSFLSWEYEVRHKSSDLHWRRNGDAVPDSRSTRYFRNGNGSGHANKRNLVSKRQELASDMSLTGQSSSEY